MTKGGFLRPTNVSYLIDDEPMEGSLEEFFAVNDFEEEEKAAMRALSPGETFTGGGGAWATFTITLVPSLT